MQAALRTVLCSPGRVQGFPYAGASAAMDFQNGRYAGGTPTELMAFTRASPKTNLTWDRPAGFAYTTFPVDVPAITPGEGLLYERRTTANLLVNPEAPATQVVTLAVGQYAMWVHGPVGGGSATISAGTAVFTASRMVNHGMVIKYDDVGNGQAVQGRWVRIDVTTAGTATVTVAGALTAFQLELSNFPTSLAVGTRSPDTGNFNSGGIFNVLSTTNGSVLIDFETKPGGADFLSPLRMNAAVIGQATHDGGFFSPNDAGANAAYGSAGVGRASSGVKAALSWAPGNRKFGVSGAAFLSAASLKSPNAGPYALGASWVGVIRRIDVWPTQVAAPTLRGLTAQGLPSPDILALGDSITERADGFSTTFQTTYPQFLGAARGQVVLNCGQGGLGCLGMLAKYQQHPELWSLPLILIAGYNDIGAATSPALVASLITDPVAAIVALNTSGKVLVCSILNGSTAGERVGGARYDRIIGVNTGWASQYGANYLDLRAGMVAAYNPAYPTDVAAFGQDIVPASLRLRGTTLMPVSIDASQTSFVTDSTLVAGTAYQFDDEIIMIDSVSGSTVTSCTRGHGGSVAAAHQARKSVRYSNTADAIHLGEKGHQVMASLIAAKIGPSGLNW